MRRLRRIVITLFVIATVAFIVMRVIPGDPALVQLGDYATPELVRAVEIELGLDRPLLEQYVSFVGGLLTGDLGYSFRSRESVSELIVANITYTGLLALFAFVMALVTGTIGGLLGARYPGSFIDKTVNVVSTVALSAPPFWTGLLLILVFSLNFGWFPVAGGGNLSDPVEALKYVALPALAIGAREAGIIARVVRSAMATVSEKDYVTTAISKGIGQRAVMLRHVLRNALLPIISMASVRLITLLSGVFVIEIVFARPGLGALLVEAIRSRDFPVVQGVVLTIALFVVAVSALGDAAYSLADPRVGKRR